MPIRLSTKNQSLKNKLFKPKAQKSATVCSSHKCPLKSFICHDVYVIYALVCASCGSNYIGSTTRQFHERHNEHCRPQKMISKHKEDCPDSNFIPYILEKFNNRDEIALRLKEAKLIKTLKPDLNKKEEYIDFSAYL